MVDESGFGDLYFESIGEIINDILNPGVPEAQYPHYLYGSEDAYNALSEDRIEFLRERGRELAYDALRNAASLAISSGLDPEHPLYPLVLHIGACLYLRAYGFGLGAIVPPVEHSISFFEHHRESLNKRHDFGEIEVDDNPFDMEE